MPRPKGTPNKASQFSKIVITNMLSDYHLSGLMEQDLATLSSRDRLHVMLKLAEFVTPKPQAIDMSITNEHQSTIADTLAQLAQENENP